MCGICGIVEKSGERASSVALHHMANTMIHRGPDGEGYIINGPVGLGMRRLSIVDVANGAQPISNEDGTISVIMNGEIYNYQTLFRQLVDQGHKFRTLSDAEVIVHLYEERGMELLKDLRGMFAFAILDMQQETTFVVRDHFGIKPVFYAAMQDRTIFASDINSILASGYIKPEVNLQSLWDYLTFQYVPHPNTMFKGILKLPPGHYLRLQGYNVNTIRYWSAQFNPDESKPLSYFVEGLQEKLRNSVDVHLMGETPRGTFLSSGIDSSTIAALMRQREFTRTFSVGYEYTSGLSGFYDELELSAQTAKLLGTEHHQTIISPGEFVEALPRLMYYQEDPVADPSAIPLFFVARLASSHATVVLSGEGADELFGGYPIYHEPKSLQMFDYVPKNMREGLMNIAKRLPQGMKGRSFIERGSLPLERRFVGNAKIFTDDEKSGLLHSDFPVRQMASSFSITDIIYAANQTMDDITRMQEIDVHTWLPGDILAKADKMSMANSLELRVPFLDREVFDFASTIPVKYRIKGGQAKYVLRQTLTGILPDEIRTRPKRGFPVPLSQWLQGPLSEFVWSLLRTSDARRYFNPDFLNDLMREHVCGVQNHARKLWVIIIFMLWHEVYIEQKYQFSPAVSPLVEVRRRRIAQGAELSGIHTP